MPWGKIGVWHSGLDLQGGLTPGNAAFLGGSSTDYAKMRGVPSSTSATGTLFPFPFAFAPLIQPDVKMALTCFLCFLPF